VRLGEDTVLVLYEADPQASAEERARQATAALAASLLDPECGPEMLAVIDDGGPVIELCSRRVLGVSELDAQREGQTRDALARDWAERLRQEFGERKQSEYSRRLLHTAVVGLFLPLGYLLLLLLIRLAFQRLRRLSAAGQTSGEGASRLATLFGAATWRAVAQTGVVVKWALYVMLTYVFAVSFLRLFPASARWATLLLQPLQQAASQLAPQLLSLLPRLFAAVLVLIAARAAWSMLSRLFEQIRAGRLRLEPMLSPETAGPVAVTARALTVIVTGVALVLVLVAPGRADIVALGIFALLGLTLVLAARDDAANLVSGLVILYTRPFRTGERIRAGRVAGTVSKKTLLYTRIEAAGSRELLVPNSWLLRRPVEIAERERTIRLRVTLDSSEGPEPAQGLFRHAAAEVGCRREAGQVFLVEVQDRQLIYEIEWDLPKGAEVRDVRSQFMSLLLTRASSMHIRVLRIEASRSLPS
jgi:small-conductance mechanosensitive channel